MRLILLERFVRIETRIVILEADHHSQRYPVPRKPVEPSSSVHARIQRPSERVGHIARLDASDRNVPQLLDSYGIDLRGEAIELQAVHHIFGERAARAFG